MKGRRARAERERASADVWTDPRSVAIAAAWLTLVLAGCGQATGSDTARTPVVETSAPAHVVVDTGVEDAPLLKITPETTVDVTDPTVLRDISPVVISGRVIGVEKTFVIMGGFIMTTYSVEVASAYKGDDIPKIVSVSLPGGTLPLGEYISAMKDLGISEMLAPKGPSVTGDEQSPDARTTDPSLPRTENWGTNPASASLLNELQPDLWVFYLGGLQDGEYYGTALDHALRYLKDGQVHSVHPEAKGSPFPESELYGDR